MKGDMNIMEIKGEHTYWAINSDLGHCLTEWLIYRVSVSRKMELLYRHICTPNTGNIDLKEVINNLDRF